MGAACQRVSCLSSQAHLPKPENKVVPQVIITASFDGSTPDILAIQQLTPPSHSAALPPKPTQNHTQQTQDGEQEKPNISFNGKVYPYFPRKQGLLKLHPSKHHSDTQQNVYHQNEQNPGLQYQDPFMCKIEGEAIYENPFHLGQDQELQNASMSQPSQDEDYHKQESPTKSQVSKMQRFQTFKEKDQSSNKHNSKRSLHIKQKAVFLHSQFMVEPKAYGSGKALFGGIGMKSSPNGPANNYNNYAEDFSSFSSRSQPFLGSYNDKQSNDKEGSLHQNGESFTIEKGSIHLTVPQLKQLQTPPTGIFCPNDSLIPYDKEAIITAPNLGGPDDSFKDTSKNTEKYVDVIRRGSNQNSKSQEEKNDSIHIESQDTPQAYHRHLTGHAKRKEPSLSVINRNAFVEIAVGDLCGGSNNSSSRVGHDSKSKNENSVDTNKEGSIHHLQPKEKPKKSHFARPSDILTSYFPTPVKDDIKGAFGNENQGSPPQSLKDFFLNRDNNSSHDASSSKDGTDYGENNLASFDKKKFNKQADALSQGSMQKRQSVAPSSYQRQISNVTFLKPQQSIRNNAHGLGFTENESNFTSSSPKFMNKQSTARVGDENKSAFFMNQKKKTSKLQYEPSEKSESHSTLKTNSSLQDQDYEEEEEEKIEMDKKKSSTFLNGGTGDEKPNLPQPVQETQRSIGGGGSKGVSKKESNSNLLTVNEEKKDGEMSQRFMKLQTFKDWVARDNQLNMFKTQEIEEEEQSPPTDDGQEAKPPVKAGPNIVVMPPNQQQFQFQYRISSSSQAQQSIDQRNSIRGDEDQIPYQIDNNSVQAYRTIQNRKSQQESNQLLSAQSGSFRNLANLNPRIITPKNQMLYGNSKMQRDSNRPLFNRFQYEQQLYSSAHNIGMTPSRNRQGQLVIDTRSPSASAAPVYESLKSHLKKQKSKGLLVRSRSDRFDNKCENSEGSTNKNLKKGERQNLQLLEKICDQVNNQIVKHPTQQSINSSTGLFLIDSSKGGSIRTMVSNFRNIGVVQQQKGRALSIPRQKEVATPIGGHGQKSDSRNSEDVDTPYTPSAANIKSSTEFQINIIAAPEEGNQSIGDQSVTNSSMKYNLQGETGQGPMNMRSVNSTITSISKSEEREEQKQSFVNRVYSTIVELPDEDQKSSIAMTDRKVTQQLTSMHTFNNDTKSFRSIMEEDSALINESLDSKNFKDPSKNPINMSPPQQYKQSNTLNPPQIQRRMIAQTGGLISRTRSQVKDQNEFSQRPPHGSIGINGQRQMKAVSNEYQTPQKKLSEPISDGSEVKLRIESNSRNFQDDTPAKITQKSLTGQKMSFTRKMMQQNSGKTRNDDPSIKQNYTANLPPRHESKLSQEKSQIIVPTDQVYKFSHNIPNVKGRNLISSIKKVVQKCDNAELSAIPNLLQQVRINSIKNQMEKQFQDTNSNLVNTDKNLAKVKLPIISNLKRQATIDQSKADSERLVLINKNTLDEDQREYNQYEDLRVLDDQSCNSNNTPINLDYPYNLGMYSPGSSNRTPDASSIMYGNYNGVYRDYRDFNPLEVTVEIQQQNTTFDNITSTQSRESPTNRNFFSSMQDQQSQVSTPQQAHNYLHQHQHNMYLQSINSPMNHSCQMSQFGKSHNAKQKSLKTIDSFKMNKDQVLQLVPQGSMSSNKDAYNPRDFSKGPTSITIIGPNGTNATSQQFYNKNAVLSQTLHTHGVTHHMQSMQPMLPRKADGILDNMAQTTQKGANPHLHHSSSQGMFNMPNEQKEPPNNKNLNDNFLVNQSTTHISINKPNDKRGLFLTKKLAVSSDMMLETPPKQNPQPAINDTPLKQSLERPIQMIKAESKDLPNNNSQSTDSYSLQELKNEVAKYNNEDDSGKAKTTTFQQSRKASHRDNFYNAAESPKTAKNIINLKDLSQKKDATPYGFRMSNTNSLSPYNDNKSPRSITTLSAISTKVNGKKLINQYVIIQTIGRGKYSKVAQCMDQKSKQLFAMKVINKNKLKKIIVGKNKYAYDSIKTEIAVLKKLDHPNIVRLFEIIDDPKHDKLYLITELVKHGTLQDRILGKPQKPGQIVPPVTDEIIRKYFRQLILAVEYCHDKAKIIHRDIKPENILLDENDNIKLSDFGVSFMMENGTDELYTSAGSYYFYSPEACLGSTYKGKKSDIWACGVTLYFMIYKQCPFESNVIPELFKKIQNEEPTYRPSKPGMLTFSVDPQLKELLKSILTKNPEDRYSISEIKRHPWITQGGTDPMPLLDTERIEVSETEIKSAFGTVNIIGQVILKKLSVLQNGKKPAGYNLTTEMLMNMGPITPKEQD